MKVEDFKYNLPEDHIAKFPPKKRGTTKLLVVEKEKGIFHHRKYTDIVDYIGQGDVVVVNRTKVEKRRVYFQNSKGRIIEVLFLNMLTDGNWYVLLKGGKHVAMGEILLAQGFADIKVKIIGRYEEGYVLKPLVPVEEIFSKIGHTPIPPYMKREESEEDYERYNTVFAKGDGSVASPTASINLTEDILNRIEAKGVKIVEVELKIGWGTFAPLRCENVEDHKIHKEEIALSSDVANIVNRCKKSGKRVFAFGTTVARVLESCVDDSGNVISYNGHTDLYIYPGYRWRVVDALVTNFHMPDSSLILLVSSFAGKDIIKRAYEEAINNGYMFLSYGDSMLLI